MRVRVLLGGILAIGLLNGSAFAQQSCPEGPVNVKFFHLPINRQATHLKGQAAAVALRKAEAIVIANSPNCDKPALRHNTVALSRATADGDHDIAESEIWYFDCPELVPVLVRYHRAKGGAISDIHAREFGVFAQQIPHRPLSDRPSKTARLREFPKPTGIYEASCFGILSSPILERIDRYVPHRAHPSRAGLTQTLLAAAGLQQHRAGTRYPA